MINETWSMRGRRRNKGETGVVNLLVVMCAFRSASQTVRSSFASLHSNEMCALSRVMMRFHALRAIGDAEKSVCVRSSTSASTARNRPSTDRESPTRWIMGARTIQDRADAFGRKSPGDMEGARDAFDVAATGSRLMRHEWKIIAALRATKASTLGERGTRSATLRHPHSRLKAPSQCSFVWWPCLAVRTK